MKPPTAEQKAFDRVVEIAGGKTTLMRALNELGHFIGSHNAIHQWRANRVPANYCPDIERLTGVPCEELRPDVAWRIVRNPSAKVRSRLRAIHTAATSEE